MCDPDASGQPLTSGEAEQVWESVLDAARLSAMEPSHLADSLIRARRAIDAACRPEGPESAGSTA